MRGVTVVLTTHYMEEAEALCHRLAIMDQGRVVTVDSPSNLIKQLDANYTVKMVVADPLTELQLAQQRLRSSTDVDAAMKLVDAATQVLLRARAALWQQKQLKKQAMKKAK